MERKNFSKQRRIKEKRIKAEIEGEEKLVIKENCMG